MDERDTDTILREQLARAEDELDITLKERKGVDARRASAQTYCDGRGIPLPFRPRPDLSTVEGCMDAFASKATMIVFRGPTALAAGKCPLHVNIQKTANGPYRDFGKPGQPATLADLQDCAKFVLGIEE